MGAKAALVVFGDVQAALQNGATPDRDAAEAVVRALRPGCEITPADDGDLCEDAYPADGLTYVAVLPEATIVCDQELATVPVAEHVLEYAGDRPLVVFAQNSTSGWLAFAEWTADGELVRAHDAEDHGQNGLADAVATELFGFTSENPPSAVLHGFRVTHPDQAARAAAFDAAVARMVQAGPRRMTLAADGSLVPLTDPS
ncbi:DUF6928 family protein [Lentzea sp. NPDC059081]|uniref:DUF6928 family protein n=1 Tax=Lentzea sp. NPDC059081 TaxID=3346719 RepID=UPI0036C987DD